MKIGSKILCAALACTLLTGAFVGCTEEGAEPTPPGPDGEVTQTAEVWSTYSSAKVTQNAKQSVPYAQLEASINIQMMKDETEGAQLIVTAEKDIGSYMLTASALSDGKGHTIPAEDISIYHQKYITVTRRSDVLNTDFQAGDYIPDMLLPIDIAKEYGENTIAEGDNQGITVEVTTTSDTEPGTYTGTFVLDLDGEKQNIPVTVEVWNIEYEGRRTFQSSFLLYRNSLIAGEYEASDELVDRYVDFLLDYNVNTYVIKDSYPVDEFVAEAQRLFANDNYNSICIPVGLSTSYTATSAMADQIVNYIVAIAEVSTPEKPYLEYLYLYPSALDEADMHGIDAAVERIFSVDGEWDKTLARAFTAVQATEAYKSFSAEFRAQVDEAVENIPAIFTNTTFRGDWAASLNAVFCPYLSVLGDDGQLQQYQDGAAANGIEDLWAYTCVGPNYPNPTFHIDDYNLGTRVTGWMAKKFGVNGYLYWAVNMYQAINEDAWRDVDVYETAERAGYCAGDGFLLYPGAYYGSEYPFASTRLAAWRDAMDDYDMLCVYEQLLNEKAADYGIEIDFNDYVNDLYDSLFAGTSYYTDDALVEAARAELASRILALKNDGIMVQPTQSGATLYAEAGSLTIDGEQVTGTSANTGYSYALTNSGTSAAEFTVATAANTYTFRVGAMGVVASFADNTGTAEWTDGSSVTYSDGAANVTIVSVYRGTEGVLDGATQRFSPYVQFGTDGLAGASAIRFTMTNTGSNGFSFTLRLVAANGTITVGTGYVGGNATRSFRFDLDSRTLTDAVLEGVTEVRIAFRNVNDAVTALEPTKTFTLGDIWYEIN